MKKIKDFFKRTGEKIKSQPFLFVATTIMTILLCFILVCSLVLPSKNNTASADSNNFNYEMQDQKLTGYGYNPKLEIPAPYKDYLVKVVGYNTYNWDKITSSIPIQIYYSGPSSSGFSSYNEAEIDVTPTNVTISFPTLSLNYKIEGDKMYYIGGVHQTGVYTVTFFLNGPDPDSYKHSSFPMDFSSITQPDDANMQYIIVGMLMWSSQKTNENLNKIGNENFIKGNEEGYEAGEAIGKDIGYGQGFDEGYDQGYEAGAGLKNVNPITYMLEPIGAILETPIFGSFSIGMGLSVALFVMLALMFIKMFAGG